MDDLESSGYKWIKNIIVYEPYVNYNFSSWGAGLFACIWILMFATFLQIIWPTEAMDLGISIAGLVRITKWEHLKARDIFRSAGDMCKQQPNLAPIQGNDEGVSFKMQISWRQPIEKTVKIQKRNNYKQKNIDCFFY